MDKSTFDIPINTITVPIRDPQSPMEYIKIEAAADSGSDIDAIGPRQIAKYKQHNLIKTDKRGIIIGTGNGPIHVKQYIPITTKCRTKKEFTSKFWCLESLPNYDFLVGKTTLKRLGWELVNKYHVWEHIPSNLDHVENDLDDLPCTNYPWKGEPDIDLTNVRIENDKL